MKLNLSSEDLAAVISISLLMAKMDDDFVQIELEAIVSTLLEQYDFSGKEDLLNQYVEYANNMDFKEVVQRLSKFGSNEKQFLFDMLTRTMAADGKITPEEKSLYQKCVDAFCLPSATGHTAATTVDPDVIAPTFITYNYTPYNNRYEGVVFPNQMPKGKNFHNWMFEYCKTKTFTKWVDTMLLKAFTEKMNLSGGRKLALLQSDGQYSSTQNQVGTALSGGYPLKQDVQLCLISPEGMFEGFTHKSVVIWLVKAIDAIFDGLSLIDLIDGSDTSKYVARNKYRLDICMRSFEKLS